MTPSKLTLVSNDDERTELDASYPDTFLACRALQHRWVVIGYYHANGEIIRSVTCERCHTDRHDRWSKSGSMRLGSSYDYAEGYAIHAGEAIRAYEVREEVLKRVTVYDSQDAMNDAIFGGRSKRAKGAS